MSKNNYIINMNKIKKYDIKHKTDIYDVVKKYIKLERFGSTLKGICPFHEESTPSFVVDQQKQVFYCFGCGFGGDVFTFIMKMHGVNFLGALEYLSQQNINGCYAYPKTRKEKIETNHDYEITQSKAIKVNEMAIRYYYNQIQNNSNVVNYFKSRRLLPETVKEFQIGYSPMGWSNLIGYMLSKNIPTDTLALCSLAIKSSNSKSFYDRFRNRIMFPIFDISGKPIAFAGRSLDSDVKPKYLNSPETKLYKKSKILYGLHKARQHIIENGYVIIVEGYIDFLSLYQAGVMNVVAICGTAITTEHGNIIKQLTNKIVFVFDGDDAGFFATERALQLFETHNFDTYTISLKDNIDPDSFINKYGKNEFMKQINNLF